MPWIKCQRCRKEAAKETTWWVCNVCGLRVCSDCVHHQNGEYGSGQKCGSCQTGQMELRPDG